MSTLQEYMLKNKNHIFNDTFGSEKNILNENNSINNLLKKHDQRIFLVNQNELSLYRYDRSIFKYYYGEDLTKKITDFIKEKEIKSLPEYELIPEVRLGKIQYLKNKINAQLVKPINKKKRIFLENEIKNLKKQENRAYKKLIKRQYSYLEASGLDNFVDSFSKFRDNLNFFKGNNPEDSVLKKSFKIVLKTINFIVTASTMATSVMGGGPIVVAIGSIILGSVLLWMLARNADKVYDLIKKILNNKFVKKILPFKIKTEEELQKEIEDLKQQIETATEEDKIKLTENLDDINKEIEALKNKDDKRKAIALSIANAMKKMEKKAMDGVKSVFSKSTKKINMSDPAMSNTIQVGLTNWKLWKIFKSPLIFFKEFFLGGLLDACKKIAKTAIDIYQKFKTKKLDPTSVEAKILEKSKEDSISDVAKREASDVSSMVAEEIVYDNFTKSFENYYLEHIKENVISNSLILTYFEKKETVRQSIPIDKLGIQGDKKGFIEVTKLSYRKDDYLFEIFPISAKLKITKQDKILKNEEISNFFKEQNLPLKGKVEKEFYFFNNDYEIFLDFLKNKKEDVTAADQTPVAKTDDQKKEETQTSDTNKNSKIIEKINNTILDNKNNSVVSYLKNLQKELQNNSLEDAIKNVSVNSENAKKIKTEIEKDLKNENEVQNKDYKDVITIEISNNDLLQKNVLYVPISQNTDAENFKLQENIPTDENIVAYLELRKTADEVKNNNFRFLGTLFAKKVFNYKDNKFINIFFEEQNQFQQISKKSALVSLKLDNNKITINSGKFLGMFGEKSKKGEIQQSFKDYLNNGVNKLKDSYFKNLEKKYEIDDKQKVESRINDEILKIVNLNFSGSVDSLIDQKTKELDEIDFGLKSKTETSETDKEVKKEDDKKEDKTENDENLLGNSKLYLPILDNNFMKVNAFKLEKSLSEILKFGDNLVGYIELEKDVTKTNRFSAKIFAKKTFSYKKIDIVKAIFEAEEQSAKNVFVDVTGEKPAILDIAYNQKTNDFSLSQKGGVLGIGKKIESKGELNPNFKQYVDNINDSIKSNTNADYKNKIKENEDLVNNILKDISNVNFSKNFRDIEEQKVLEVEKAIDNPIEYETQKAKKENTPIISSENAIALALLTAFSAAALYVHTTDGADPISTALKAFADKADVLSAAEKNNFFNVLTNENLKKLEEVPLENTNSLVKTTVSNLTNSNSVKDLINIANQGKSSLPININKIDELIETDTKVPGDIKDAITDISQPADAISDADFNKNLEDIGTDIPENHVTEDIIKNIDNTTQDVGVNLEIDENNIKEIEENVEFFKTKVETLEKTLEEKNNLLTNAQDNLTNAKEELENVENQFQDLNKENVEILKNLSQKEISLMEKQDETLGELTNSENDLKISEDRIGQIENSLGKLSKVTSLNKEDIEKEIENLKSQIETDPENEELKNNLEQKIETKDEIEELEKTNNQLEAEKAKFNLLNQKVEDIKNTISPEKMKEIENLKNEIETLKEKTVNIPTEEKESILKNIDRIKNLNKEVIDLENDIEKTNSEINLAKENLSETEKELNTAQENLENAKIAEKELLEKESKFSLDENSEYRKAFSKYLKEFIRQKLEKENPQIDFSDVNNKEKLEKMAEAYEKSMFDKNDPYWKKAPFLEKAMEDQNATDAQKGKIFNTIAFREESWLSDNIKKQVKAFSEKSNIIKDETPIKPEEINKPEEIVKPEETNKPAETIKPEENNKPAETIKPEETNKPAETIKPEEQESNVKIINLKDENGLIPENNKIISSIEKFAQNADTEEKKSLVKKIIDVFNTEQKFTSVDGPKYDFRIKWIMDSTGLDKQNAESLYEHGMQSNDVRKDIIQKLTNALNNQTVTNDSYKYHKTSEDYLINEYFNLENKLKKIKR